MRSFVDIAGTWAREGIDAPPLIGITETREAEHLSTLEIMTAKGTVICVRHSAPDVDHDAPQPFLPIFLGGALGGLAGTGGLWQRLATRMGGVRLHYRFPSDLEQSVIDVLMVRHRLESALGVEKVALVGHSFGGGVAAAAAVCIADVIAGIVCLAGQREGTQLIGRLEGKPVFIIHGADDTHIPWQSARVVHAEAKDPKHFWVIPDGDHVMAGHVDELDERIGAFLTGLTEPASI